MRTFAELFDKADTARKAGDHEKALGLLVYAHGLLGHSTEGFHAASQLSSLYKDLGLMDRAFAVLKEAVGVLEKQELYEFAGMTYASLACGSLYTPGITMSHYQRLVERVRVFSELTATPVSHVHHDYSTDRKLRVGVLSPDLCLHSLAYLAIQPLMNFQNITGHKLFIYHLRPNTDVLTDQVAKASTKFEKVHGKSDDEIIKIITDDKIDVLLDISGYTAETRMSVFIRRAAPVQLGWISGMMTPTGLRSIPYFITDKYMQSPDVGEDFYTPILLPTALTYHSLREKELEIEHSPCDRNGHISFVSFNNPCKINNEVLGAWAKVLQAVPNSRLHLKTYSSLDTVRITHFLGKHGISEHRLIIMPPLPTATDVQMYYSRHADIFLDSWPCSGCLTSAEAMWMGVPVVSRYNEVFCSRQTHSILNTIGITDLSFPSVDEYVVGAATLANDLNRLRTLRKELRGMMSRSPLTDYKAMSMYLGKACEEAWAQTAVPKKRILDLLTSRT